MLEFTPDAVDTLGRGLVYLGLVIMLCVIGRIVKTIKGDHIKIYRWEDED